MIFQKHSAKPTSYLVHRRISCIERGARFFRLFAKNKRVSVFLWKRSSSEELSKTTSSLESLRSLQDATAFSQLPHPSVRVQYSESLPRSCIVGTGGHEKTQVRFDENVTVVEIPSRVEYSKCSKNMWTSASEIETNKRRNIFEFRADGRDWRNCKEEIDMIEFNGELVHPYTYWRSTGIRPRSASYLRSRSMARIAVREKLAAERELQVLGVSCEC